MRVKKIKANPHEGPHVVFYFLLFFDPCHHESDGECSINIDSVNKAASITHYRRKSGDFSPRIFGNPLFDHLNITIPKDCQTPRVRGMLLPSMNALEWAQSTSGTTPAENMYCALQTLSLSKFVFHSGDAELQLGSHIDTDIFDQYITDTNMLNGVYIELIITKHL